MVALSGGNTPGTGIAWGLAGVGAVLGGLLAAPEIAALGSAARAGLAGLFGGGGKLAAGARDNAARSFPSASSAELANSCGGAPPGVPFSPNQSALVSLAKEAQKTGVNRSEANTLLQWANEYGVSGRNDIGTTHWVKGDHIHIGPINHIAVK